VIRFSKHSDEQSISYFEGAVAANLEARDFFSLLARRSLLSVPTRP